MSISIEIAYMWITQDLTDGKSTLVQVIAWCCQGYHGYLLWSLAQPMKDDITM